MAQTAREGWMALEGLELTHGATAEHLRAVITGHGGGDEVVARATAVRPSFTQPTSTHWTVWSGALAAAQEEEAANHQPHTGLGVQSYGVHMEVPAALRGWMHIPVQVRY